MLSNLSPHGRDQEDLNPGLPELVMADLLIMTVIGKSDPYLHT